MSNDKYDRSKVKTKYILYLPGQKNRNTYVTFPVKDMARALIQPCRVARAHARSVDDRMQGILWW